jgi:adenosine deaminase/aminodeoxyfutalosine deaminase
MAGMGEFHRTLQKAELHVHLEGSVEPATLLELDSRLSKEDVERGYHLDTFTEFIEAYKFALARLREPEHFAIATRRLLERMAAENVRYAEINLSVGVMLFRRQDVEKIFEAVAQQARAQSAVEVRWIFDAVRQWGPADGRRVAELAAKWIPEGVVGFGIGGIEEMGPVEGFAEVFAWAKSRGLHVTPHAGETAGPESVWAAIRAGAERIGHGVRAAEDPSLLEFLCERDIPLEICISSNIATGAVASLEQHPVRRIFDAGVPITLNTDDPALFSTTLAREYELAEQVFGFSHDELAQIAENGFRYAFR